MTTTLYEKRRGAAWITLDRPAQRNALSAALINELHARLSDAMADTEVRSVVLTGAGAAFCAGADLKSPPGAVVAGGGPSRSLPDVLSLMLTGPKPVIAAVNGAAFAGGLGLVGAADIVVTAEDAPFSFSEVRIGVIPAVISVVCLPKLGIANAMRLFLTGDRFTGRDAVALGLANRAVPQEDLAASVQREVDMINLGGPHAVAECKRLVRAVGGLSPAEGFALTAPWSASLFASAEASEGMAAFREKRPAAWTVPGDEAHGGT